MYVCSVTFNFRSTFNLVISHVPCFKLYLIKRKNNWLVHIYFRQNYYEVEPLQMYYPHFPSPKYKYLHNSCDRLIILSTGVLLICLSAFMVAGYEICSKWIIRFERQCNFFLFFWTDLAITLKESKISTISKLSNNFYYMANNNNLWASLSDSIQLHMCTFIYTSLTIPFHWKLYLHFTFLR